MYVRYSLTVVAVQCSATIDRRTGNGARARKVLIKMWLVLLVSLLTWGNGVESMFKAKTSELLDFDTTQLNYGVAVTNVGEGDGPMEWVVAGYSGPNLVLQLDAATGKYKNIAQPGTPYAALMDPQGAAIGVCACDVDGDGLEEIYFLNTNGRYSGPNKVKDRLFKWRNGAYVDLFGDEPNLDVSAMFAGRSVACVDRTGSGKYGVLVATYADSKRGKFGLIEMNEADSRNDVSTGNIVLVDVAVRVGIDFSTGGRGIAVGPVFGDDGASDIYFVNEGNFRLQNRGDNSMFKNDGSGRFTNVATATNLADSEPGRGVTMADFNNDGLTDIAYGNWMGPHKLQLQKKDGTFLDVAYGSYATPTPIRTVIAADFDNNGILDIFQNNIVYYNTDASNKLFSVEPSGDKVTLNRLDIGDAAEPDGYGTGASVADIDNDGVLELLIAHGESKAEGLSFFHVTKAGGNNWLRILPVTKYDAPARGSKVTVTLDDGRKLTRIIDGGSGYLCAMEPVAHFGLGKSEAVSLTVMWPNGQWITVKLNPSDMRKTHKIEPSGRVTSQEVNGQVIYRPDTDATYGNNGRLGESRSAQGYSGGNASGKGKTSTSPKYGQRLPSRSRYQSQKSSSPTSSRSKTPSSSYLTSAVRTARRRPSSSSTSSSSRNRARSSFPSSSRKSSRYSTASSTSRVSTENKDRSRSPSRNPSRSTGYYRSRTSPSNPSYPSNSRRYSRRYYVPRRGNARSSSQTSGTSRYSRYYSGSRGRGSTANRGTSAAVQTRPRYGSGRRVPTSYNTNRRRSYYRRSRRPQSSYSIGTRSNREYPSAYHKTSSQDTGRESKLIRENPQGYHPK